VRTCFWQKTCVLSLETYETVIFQLIKKKKLKSNRLITLILKKKSVNTINRCRNMKLTFPRECLSSSFCSSPVPRVGPQRLRPWICDRVRYRLFVARSAPTDALLKSSLFAPLPLFFPSDLVPHCPLLPSSATTHFTAVSLEPPLAPKQFAAGTILRAVPMHVAAVCSTRDLGGKLSITFRAGEFIWEIVFHFTTVPL